MQSTPTVTVVVPIYNVEEFLAECLDSLVRQTIGLDALEILLVDDCGTDSSIAIAEEYAERHPDTFRLIRHDKNQGLAAARNTGIEEATGAYISFIDSDDFIDVECFEYLVDQLIATDSDLALFAFEYHSESGTVYPRNPSHRLFGLNRAIDRIEFARYPELVHALSACNKLYKLDLVKQCKRFPRGRLYEDGLFSNQTQLAARRIYITDRVVYHYRKREDDERSSITDNIFSTKKSFSDHLHSGEELKKLYNEHPDLRFGSDWFNLRSNFPFANKLLLNAEEMNFLSQSDKKDLFLRYKTLLAEVDARNSFLNVDNQHCVLVDVLEAADDFEHAHQMYKLRIRQEKAIWMRNRNIYQRLPKIVRKGIQGTKKRSRHLTSAFKTLRTSNAERARLRSDEKTFRQDKAEIQSLREEAAQLAAKHDNKLWLFCERGDEAKDNAFALFEYVRQNYPDLPAFYLIDPKSPQSDLERVQSLGNTVAFGQREHKLYFLAARVFLNTHSRGMSCPWPLATVDEVLGETYWDKKFVFLQHGITISDQSNTFGYEPMKSDMLVCGAYPEYRDICAKYGYEKNEVQYTGHARYDALSTAKPKRQILLMPTWRQYVVQPSWTLASGRSVKDSVFLRSEYFQTYQALINSPRLQELLEEHDLAFIFYPHFEIQQYLHYFTVAEGSRVQLASSKDYSPGALIQESALLITDFSSVVFDFAYGYKPNIAYQFDEKRFYGKHYGQGYFNWHVHGFGPVVTTEDAVLNELEKSIDAEFSLDEKYRMRVDRFFPLRDTRNCQRIYEAVQTMLSGQPPSPYQE